MIQLSPANPEVIEQFRQLAYPIPPAGNDSFCRELQGIGVNEEYFEWISLLTAVRSARERFTMIELGAGWGRWLLRAAAALRLQGDIPFRLVGVEAEPTHYQWMHREFRKAGIDPADHWLIEAAVNARAEDVYFFIGDAADWYGQCIAPAPDAWSGQPYHVGRDNWWRKLQRWLGLTYRRSVYTRKVKSVTLNSLLEQLNDVDLIDADIQGAEADVFEASAARVDEKVRSVHIGTHSAEQEARLRQLFGGLGWDAVFDFPCAGRSATPWGTVTFVDGVQSWRNPHKEPKDLQTHLVPNPVG